MKCMHTKIRLAMLSSTNMWMNCGQSRRKRDFDLKHIERCRTRGVIFRFSLFIKLFNEQFISMLNFSIAAIDGYWKKIGSSLSLPKVVVIEYKRRSKKMSQNAVDDLANDENERDEELEELRRKADGSRSSQQRKRLFDDVTFEHNCTLPGKVLRNDLLKFICHFLC